MTINAYTSLRILAILCVCLAYTSTTKVVKNSRGCKSLIGKLLNTLRRLARGKLVCGDANSEGSPSAKACTEEHEPYKRQQHPGKQAQHCEAHNNRMLV